MFKDILVYGGIIAATVAVAVVVDVLLLRLIFWPTSTKPIGANIEVKQM